MMTLIIGGSGSGKSVYAENCLLSRSEGKRKYYLATMQASDRESRERIARHRKQRAGKGFHTIEKPAAIQSAAEDMEEGENTALLECISNLTANEMFAGKAPKEEKAVAEAVVNGIAGLEKRLTYLVVVSNNVFEDGRVYDETTMAYIRAMGRINERLADMADEVVEVVAGIPVVIKRREDF